MYRYLSCFILLIAVTATAQNPLPRQGNSCPTGTYKSRDYCKRISSSDREALPGEKGVSCPTGWQKSGGYCVKQ